MDKDIITTKIKRESLRQLKIIAAMTGETMLAVLERLLAAELRRLQEGEKERNGKP